MLLGSTTEQIRMVCMYPMLPLLGHHCTPLTILPSLQNLNLPRIDNL